MLCGTTTLPNLKGVGGTDGPACGVLGHDLGPETPPSAFSSDSPETMVLLTVINHHDDTDSVVRDVTNLRKLLPGPDAKGPVRTYVTGQAAVNHDFSEWKGRPLMVNFWATWCDPCRREIPLLKKLRQERSAESLEVVGIAVDFRAEVIQYAHSIGIDLQAYKCLALVISAGFTAWLLWAGVHIYFLIGFANRLFVMFRWLVQFVTRQHGVGAISADR